MTLRIHANPAFNMSPAEDQKGKNHIARRAGKKHVSGNIYKDRSRWKLICDWVGASKGASIMGKAATESRHYVQAAALRKAFSVGPECSGEEFNGNVWNSAGVQDRITRQDHMRFNPRHFSRAHGASCRNRIAYALSRLAHLCHGFCEMMAAPTGMTNNVLKNFITGKVEDKSGKNRFFMAILLPAIGLGTGTGFVAAGIKIGDTVKVAGKVITSVLIGFPLASGTLGFIGTGFALLAQQVAEKQPLSSVQKMAIENELNTNLQRLLHRIKTVKGNSQLVNMLGDAMQGKAFLDKFRGARVNGKGIPIILNQVIDVVDLNKSDTENMQAMQQVLGAYLQVERASEENPGLHARYTYSKAVTRKEGHYAALMALVDHVDILNEHEDELLDARKRVEDKATPWFHDLVLKALAYPVSVVDPLFGTKGAEKLRKWASDNYRKNYIKNVSNPELAAKYRHDILYMFNNRHQYGPITRALMLFADGVYLMNIGIVLSSNGQISRIYNNITYILHKLLLTSPPSRSMSNSLGRGFGGLTLAAILGAVGIGLAGSDPENPDYSVHFPHDNSRYPVVISFINIGILMSLLAIPTLFAQGLAKLAAKLEGWQGNIPKPLPPEDRQTVWSNK